MVRLFTALEIPALQRQQLALLRSPLPGARWLDADDLHITLRFVGDIDNDRARAFVDALARVDADPFEVRVAGLGAFGGKEPRSLWAKVDGGEALEALARANERAARAAGLPPETRSYKPHITLTRLRNTRPDVVARFLQHNGSFRLEPFIAERFVLMSSRPQVGGGPYVVEEVFPMWEGAGDEDDARW